MFASNKSGRNEKEKENMDNDVFSLFSLRESERKKRKIADFNRQKNSNSSFL